MTETRRFVAVALLAAAALTAPRARAASPEDEKKSRLAFEEADALANQGRWKDACFLFQRAHDLHATNGTAYRTGECYEHIGEDDKAIPLFQYVIDHAATDKVQNRPPLAEQHLKDARERIALAKAAAAYAQKHPFDKGDKGGKGGKGPQNQSVPLRGGAPPPLVPNRVPAIIALAAGGAGAIAGGIFGGLTLAAAGDIKSTCGSPPTCQGYSKPEFDSAVSSMHTKGWAANVAIGVGVVGLTTGVVLLALGYPKHAAKAKSALGPGGVTIRF